MYCMQGTTTSTVTTSTQTGSSLCAIQLGNYYLVPESDTKTIVTATTAQYVWDLDA